MYHSLWGSATWYRSPVIIVLWKRSAYQFVWGWYAKVVRCFVPKKVHRVSKKILINFVPLSVNTCIGILYRIIQMYVNNDAMCSALVLDIGLALVNFE